MIFAAGAQFILRVRLILGLALARCRRALVISAHELHFSVQLFGLRDLLVARRLGGFTIGLHLLRRVLGRLDLFRLAPHLLLRRLFILGVRFTDFQLGELGLLGVLLALAVRASDFSAFSDCSGRPSRSCADSAFVALRELIFFASCSRCFLSSSSACACNSWERQWERERDAGSKSPPLGPRDDERHSSHLCLRGARLRNALFIGDGATLRLLCAHRFASGCSLSAMASCSFCSSAAALAHSQIF